MNNILEVHEIDKIKTKNNADYFLRKNFIHYVNLAGMNRNHLTSINFDNIPTKNNQNINEKIIINEVKDSIDIVDPAKKAVSAIYRTMDNCTSTPQNPFRTILLDIYVQNKTISQIAMKTNLSESTIGNKRKIALCEFAERFEFWKKEFNGTYLPTLIVYED